MTVGSVNAGVAYEVIRRKIVTGEYGPSMRLIEQRLGEELGLSRTPIREALRRLEAEGLVQSQPNRSAQVRPIRIADIHDTYELRARLESYGAELAAQRALPADLDAISAGIEAFSVAMAQVEPADVDSVQAVHEANATIHGAIVAAAHHRQLGSLLARTVDVPLVFQSFRKFDPDELARSHLFHQLIFAAIEAKEPDRARRLMLEHIFQGRDVLLAHVEASAGSEEQLFGDLESAQ